MAEPTQTIEATMIRARALAKGGQLAEAAALYRGVLARFPNNQRAKDGLAGLGLAVAPDPSRVALIRTLLVAGRLPEALDRLQPLLATHPGSAELHFLAGAVLARLGRPDAALAQYLTALRLAPGMAEAQFGAGNMLYLMGRYAEAVPAFETVVQADPGNDDARNNLGLALHRLGRLAVAAECFEQALARKPAARTWFHLGNVQSDQGQPEAAIASYRQALALQPDHAEAANNLGNVLRDKGETVAAMDAYRQALRSRPDYAACHGNLADLHRFSAGEPWIAEMQGLLTAARTDPEKVHYGFALGKAFDDVGDPEAAFAAWQEANRLRKRAAGL